MSADESSGPATPVRRQRRSRAPLYGCLAVLLLLAIPVGYVGWLAFTTIHDNVSEGSAYGFTIGMTKREAFERARECTGLGQLHGLYHAFDDDGQAPDERRTFVGLPDDFRVLEPWDNWEFYFTAERTRQDQLELNFDDGRLLSIYRHRQFFELP